MGKFKSINYSRVVCEGCGSETSIEPGIIFKELNCNCNEKALEQNHTKANEISTPVQKELDYVKNQTVTVIGRFEDGDYEVINSNDATDSWRVPKDTFESTYEVQAPAFSQEILDTHADGSETNEVTLSLDALVGKTKEEIKDEFNMDELRVLAKGSKIRGASQMKEDKLVEKLLQKV